MAGRLARRELPPRSLPVLDFGLAHAALVLAFATVALDARAVAAFLYHARMLAVVHLVTLGWITSSILEPSTSSARLRCGYISARPGRTTRRLRS